MLTRTLPEQVDHQKMVKDLAVLKGCIALAQFSRLTPLLLGSDGDVEIELAFSGGHGQPGQLRGSATCQVSVVCQTCLEPMQVTLAIDVAVKLVKSELQLLDLAQEDDGLVVESNLIRLVDIFEDELIINLPMVPRHLEGSCTKLFKPSEPLTVAETETYKPFADLANLQSAKLQKEQE